MKFITNYENIFFKALDKISFFFNALINILFKTVIFLIIGLEKVCFSLISILNVLGIVMRYSTYPFHWIWIKLDIKKFDKNKVKELPIFVPGAHYFYGPPASGKSTSVFHAMTHYAYLTGKTSYTTQPMELPRRDVYGRDYYYHQYLRPEDIYDDGEQKYAFDTKRHNMMVYEEMLGDYHQRNNSKNSHNDQILPLVASMGGQRHQGEGMDLFYFISQLPGNDIAIMQMLKGYHIPKIVKRFDYKNWLKTGKYRWVIKGWRMISYNIQPVGRHDYKLVNEVKWFYNFEFEDDFKYFNMLNLAGKYKDMKVLKAREMMA